MNVNILSSLKQYLSAVILTCISFGSAHAVAIPFGFEVTMGQEVHGEVLGLNPSITDAQMSIASISIISSPFTDAEGVYEQIFGRENEFSFDSLGVLISADFVGGFMNADGVSFTIDFNSLLNPSTNMNGGNVLTFSRIANANLGLSGVSVTARVFPDVFNFVPTSSVPSPPPIALLGAGVIAFAMRRTRTQLPVKNVIQ